MRLAIETDDELCAAFGNNATALNTYIGDLIAKASIVYSRDVGTTLSLGQVNLRTGGPGTDPWTSVPASGTGAALASSVLLAQQLPAGVVPALDGSRF